MTEEDIFAAAAALPAEGRAASLDSACAGRPEMRARIEALLRSNDASGFMDQPTGVASGADSLPTGENSSAEHAGARIGRYKLLQKLGEGGFGVVWMAEQVEPVTRRVALKIIKAGMDTREVIARFEAERQALAMMDHPNIARVFDAGATNKGRPYFVMELVKGIPITRFCDDRRFATLQRLELFADVCSAINHAHQKGIIHRDVKPSNVMVTLNADRPVVKVIDFGIAKAVQGRLTDRTLFTRFEQFIGTPAYMSPEQAAISEVDVDTRSDIYALGILLYELLTGKPPFDAKSLLSAGYEEMRRIIREVEPPKPSTRLKELLTASTEQYSPESEPSGANQSTDDSPKGIGGSREQLKHQRSRIDADLDWIVMKAIEKDRARRYETANGLALDIQRFLADEPVSAGPPSAAYRVRKFVRRNKAGLRIAVTVAALLTIATFLSTWHTAAIAVVLIVATSVSTWLAVRATQAGNRAIRKAADEELAREDAEAVSACLNDVFQSADPARDGPSITVTQILDRAVKKLDSTLASHPQRRAKLYIALSGTFYSLGQYRAAIPLLEDACQFYASTVGREHPDTLGVMHRLANACHAAGRLDEALHLREEVFAMRRRILGPGNIDTLWSMHTLANSYHGIGRTAAALELRETLLELFRKLHGPESDHLHFVMNNLANSWEAVGRMEEASSMREEVLALRCKSLGPEHPDTLGAISNLATSHIKAGRLSEAVVLREQVLDLSRKVNGRLHPDTLCAMINLGWSYHSLGRYQEAVPLLEEARDHYVAVLGGENPATLDAMSSLGKTYINAGHVDHGLELLTNVLELRRKVLGSGHPDTLVAHYNLAVAFQTKGNFHDAKERALHAREGFREKLGAEHPDSLRSAALYEGLLASG